MFEQAFGDQAITAGRIAFAIATYERTLIPDQTPWDSFNDGNVNALTANQARGWDLFQQRRCNDCHDAPHFTENRFRNIGLRPVAEDTGRQAVTGLTADRGKFKVPTLRNTGLKRNFMHNGQFTSLDAVLRFYADAPGTVQFADNQDPLLQQTRMPPPDQAAVVDFIRNGLTDPRVASRSFPFDKPTLYSERQAQVLTQVAVGRAGTGGTPSIIALSPPLIGGADFKLGIDGALAGASAFDADSGGFKIAISGIDLRTALGVDQATGELLVPVAIDIADSSLETPSVAGELTFDYDYSARRDRTTGVFKLTSNAVADGVFQVTKTTAREKNGGHVVSLTALLACPDGGALVPTDAITVTIGDADPIVINAADIGLRGHGDSSGFAVARTAGIAKLKYQNSKRTLTLTTDALDGTGIPADLAVSTGLSVRIDVPTEDGTRSFGTTVAIRRAKSSARTWRR